MSKWDEAVEIATLELMLNPPRCRVYNCPVHDEHTFYDSSSSSADS